MSSARIPSVSADGPRATPPGRRSRATRTDVVGSRAGGDTTLPAGPRRWLPPAALLAGPILGAVLGGATGGYHGPLFALFTIASAALATAAVTPNGRWWVIPALPPLAWLVAAVAEVTLHDPPYGDSKAKAVGLVHATTHVFPVILAALVTMGLVSVVTTLRTRTRTRSRTRRHPSGGRRA